MPAQGYIRLDYLFHRQNKTITMKLIVKLFILDSFIQTNRVSDPLIVSPLISPYISVGLHQILLQGLFLCSDSSWCFRCCLVLGKQPAKGLWDLNTWKLLPALLEPGLMRVQSESQTTSISFITRWPLSLKRWFRGFYLKLICCFVI